jgi:3-hydroxyacyl-[acyl-carrier-protein] dehydratase
MSEVARFAVPADHPCLPGHFPGRPVVPGVVLLDRVMRVAGSMVALGGDARLHQAKFLRPVLPEEVVEVALRRTAAGRLAFTGHVGGVLAFQGEMA